MSEAPNSSMYTRASQPPAECPINDIFPSGEHSSLASDTASSTLFRYQSRTGRGRSLPRQ
uniref:Uncharacterized protein n=1 Tax=Arundo donax TaxID=35708 RepID=A0A0A9DIH9_ARUDO